MVDVVFDFTLESAHVLAVDLEGEGPEGSLPNHTCLSVLDSEVIFVFTGLRTNCEVEISDIEPKRHHESTADNGPNLEPTFRVD